MQSGVSTYELVSDRVIRWTFSVPVEYFSNNQSQRVSHDQNVMSEGSYDKYFI